MSFFFLNLKCSQLSREEDAFKSSVFVSNEIFSRFKCVNNSQAIVYVELNGFVFTIQSSESCSDESFEVGKLQREFLELNLYKIYKISWFPANENTIILSSVALKISKLDEDFKKISLQEQDIINQIKNVCESTYLKPKQLFYLKVFQTPYIIEVLTTESLNSGFKNEGLLYDVCGSFSNHTEIELMSNDPKNLVIVTENGNQDVFKKNFSLLSMEVGGLQKELNEIFRRVFATRRFPSHYLSQFGINHVRGILLHGPPGTGKTLIAREIAKGLRSKNIKIINGPEVLNKFVGESEKMIRELFEDAKKDQNLYGEKSSLHIIIFDEIDAICKRRGTTMFDAGVNDSVVNQLLSMIDGVDALNNVIIIGMTNRLDMVDEAIMRPGRLEIQIEINLPNKQGREEIFAIHTSKLKKNNRLAQDVDLKILAEKTINFTGAEIEGVVKNACSYAFKGTYEITDFKNVPDLSKECKVTMENFEKSLSEMVPYFGREKNKLEKFNDKDIFLAGNFQQFKNMVSLLMKSFENMPSSSKNLKTLLFNGTPGNGKTTWAVWASKQIEFSFLKLISSENMVGFNEDRKISFLVNIFEDSYKAMNSCIILDNIEEIFGYLPMENSVQMNVIRTLISLVSKSPKKIENNLLIIATTSNNQILNEVNLAQKFEFCLEIPSVSSSEPISQFLSKTTLSMKDKETLSKKLLKKSNKISFKKLKLILDLMNAHKSAPSLALFDSYYKLIKYGIKKNIKEMPIAIK